MVDIVVRLLMALEAVVCLMLIGVILIQRTKGQGIGLSFGGGAAESVFGGQMGNVLTRTTVVLAFVFLVNTTLLAILKPKGVSASVVDRISEPAAEVADATASDDGAAAPSDAELAAALEDTAATAEAKPAAEAEAEAKPAAEAEAKPAAETEAKPAEAEASGDAAPEITAAAPAAAPAAE